MKLQRLINKNNTNEFLSLLKELGYVNYEQTNSNATYDLMQHINDLLTSKIYSPFNFILNDYDKETFGEEINSLIEQSNFKATIISSVPTFFKENETPEIDNSEKYFYITVCTRIIQLYKEKFNLKTK